MSWRTGHEMDAERKKVNYSLFQALSPVLEEEESLYTPRSCTPPASPAARRSPESPYSPLPSLIIEREPNKHDESKEFYVKFEKRMKKAYRRLFIEGCSSVGDISDSDNDHHDVTEKKTSASSTNLPEITPDVEIPEMNSTERAKSISDGSQTFIIQEQSAGSQNKTEEHMSSSTVMPRSTIGSLNTDEEDSSSEKLDDSDVSDITKLNTSTEENVETAPSSAYEQENIESDDNNEVNDGSAILDKNDGSDINNIISPTEDHEALEIEVMRSARIDMSAGSMQEATSHHSPSSDNGLRERSRSIEAEIESEASRELEQNLTSLVESIDYDMLQTSVQHGENSNANVASKNVSRKRKSSLSTSSSSKRVKYEDKSTQTNFQAEAEEVNRRILGDLFIVPIVYTCRRTLF